jgi:hypothetical protein
VDDPPDVSCKDSTSQYAVDDPLLSCNSRLGVRVPRQLPKGARHSLQVQVFAGRDPLTGRKRWLSRQVRGQTKAAYREAKKVEALVRRP